MQEAHSEDRLCDECDLEIKRRTAHFHCKTCKWDFCCTCAKAILALRIKKRAALARRTVAARTRKASRQKARGKGGSRQKRQKTTRGDHEHCGKSIEMPASFWKITDGTFFKGVIQHIATWDFNDRILTGYDILWHTGESELVPLADLKPYL